VADLDLVGLDQPAADVELALEVRTDEWSAEIPQITEWFDKFGDSLPTTLLTELDGHKARLGM
jgi:phosphoenolpyruvate carboxykinase (GTP)